MSGLLGAIETRADIQRVLEKRETKFVTLGIFDMQGLLRGKYVSTDKFLKVLDDGYGLPLTSMCMDPTDAILSGDGLLDGSDGYADATASIIPNTICEIPWEPKDRNLLILSRLTEASASYCPRSVYDSTRAMAIEKGFLPAHSIELEFTLFNETAKTVSEKNYTNLEPATHQKSYELIQRQSAQTDFYGAVMDACEALSIPIESFHEEMGAGFMEVALRYGINASVPEKALLFRTFCKVVAERQSKLATFMARWSDDADGHGGHTHISLTSTSGEPLFWDKNKNGNMSDAMRHFIGGVQALLPDFLLLYAPNLNSFKRLVPGIFAPTHATWGVENRTCALRVVGDSPSSIRVECRVPGADANPYLSLSGLIGSGIHGIENKIEPTEPIVGNGFDQKISPKLAFPKSFPEAIERFSSSQIARDILGDEFVSVFANTRRAQNSQLSKLVTDVEKQRYLQLL
jgi:glutamine synthetase